MRKKLLCHLKIFKHLTGNRSWDFLSYAAVPQPTASPLTSTREYNNPSSSFIGFYNPLAGFSLLILEVSRSHTMTQHSRQDSSGRVPDNTQHSPQTNIHAPGGIRNRNPSRQTAAEPRLIPLGHWYRLDTTITVKKVPMNGLFPEEV
jgi:hypothetical protein